ncbi:hypothetical protein KC361_g294 [Hortaea werneckii]|nr:hypothetical protein KC361_g294 [Hortaea werneckii]
MLAKVVFATKLYPWLRGSSSVLNPLRRRTYTLLVLLDRFVGVHHTLRIFERLQFEAPIMFDQSESR